MDNHRFTEDVVAYRLDEPMPDPVLAGSLLSRLKVYSQPLPVQQAAVHEWLQSHTPHPFLRGFRVSWPPALGFSCATTNPTWEFK